MPNSLENKKREGCGNMQTSEKLLKTSCIIQDNVPAARVIQHIPKLKSVLKWSLKLTWMCKNVVHIRF